MRSNRNIFYPMWSGAILLCIVLVLFSLIIVSCSGGGDDGNTANPQADGEPAGTQSGSIQGEQDGEGNEGQSAFFQQSLARLGETADAGQEYIDKITFLGDSTTYGLMYYGVLSGGEDTTQVWTPASGTLTLANQGFATIIYPETGEELTIAAAVSAKKPEYLLITLGVNGVSFMDEEYFMSEYESLVRSVQEASPDTKIILNSIYPVASYYSNIDEISNEKIAAANRWIERVAENTGVKFLNTYEVIADSDGTLPAGYNNDDGIHLNAEGFNVVLNYIRTHAYDLQQG